MIKNIVRLLIASIIICVPSVTAYTQVPELPVSGKTCEGSFVNPLSDVCWECLGPITIGSVEVYESDKYDYGNPSLPLCFCGIRPGIAIGYWEPKRLIDATKTPWCFPSIGGVSLDPGIGFDTGSSGSLVTNDRTTSWQAHYYVYPLLYWLEFAVDVLCAETGGFDIGYVTELDPLWQNDMLSIIIHPETIIFANPVAILACSADCVASATGRSNKELFWCQGCQGGTYPMTGNLGAGSTLATGAMTAAQRMTFKLHRQVLAFTSAGSENMCTKSPEIRMDKRQYRYQMTYPKAITDGKFTCPNIGFPTSLYDVGGVTRPVKGEDFGYLLWGKRNCCAL